ncbi:DUF1428 family protein [Pseudoduganella eburnea]|uniref:DUF1428 family protein n=1 Tax=Massilia eburnea TaxID=1776165 RepID=A0A6L6QHC7_9BURK|nr:DUF1428 domain-containing protein [Massilia eburnea]MTW11888.1 DUF1428 family protein [Massilia eburnea]
MPYVDGFILPVPSKNMDAYLEMSRQCAKVWREYGAIQYRECVADDVKVGVHTSFPQAVKLEDGEVVVFSWIIYPSKEVRDSCNEKVMSDPRMKDMMDPARMPFDGKRLIYGGFEMLIDL